MSDRPISDESLSIVREMCSLGSTNLGLPLHVVKEMIARIDREEAAPETFDDAMKTAERHMSDALEALVLAMVYAQDECPNALRMLDVVHRGLREMSQTAIDVHSFR